MKKIKEGSLKKGDKVYAINKNKAVALFHIGSEDLSEGLAIIVAHLDSPRLNLNPVPLKEDGGVAYLKTHYYGGVKIPLGKYPPKPSWCGIYQRWQKSRHPYRR